MASDDSLPKVGRFQMITDNGKRFFGPPMSATIFATKWLGKFQLFITNHYIKPVQDDDPLNLPSMYLLSVDGLTHYMHFCKDARDLDFGHYDFPHAPIPSNGNASETKAGEVTLNDLPAMNYNPFEAASTVMLVVDCFIERLKEVKYGRRFLGLGWHSLSFKQRQNMNDAFVLTDEGRKVGWWSVSDEERQTGKDEFDMRENMKDGGNL